MLFFGGAYAAPNEDKTILYKMYIYIYSNNELTLHVLFLFNINYAK